MRSTSPCAAFALLLAFFAAAPALWALEFPSTAIAHPGGCHDSMPENPSPAPADHQCCAGGHQWAVAVPMLIALPAMSQARMLHDAHELQPQMLPVDRISISDSPPITTSLRV